MRLLVVRLKNRLSPPVTVSPSLFDSGDTENATNGLSLVNPHHNLWS
jgi:hypothetical protein